MLFAHLKRMRLDCLRLPGANLESSTRCQKRSHRSRSGTVARRSRQRSVWAMARATLRSTVFLA
jgi:hypothetical protein